jgi:hypothetical protein
MRATSASVSGPLISSRSLALPRLNSSSRASRLGSFWPVNEGENHEPASSPSRYALPSAGSAPVPSVVRSTVLSCRMYGTPSAFVATSVST